MLAREFSMEVEDDFSVGPLCPAADNPAISPNGWTRVAVAIEDVRCDIGA